MSHCLGALVNLLLAGFFINNRMKVIEARMIFVFEN
jgi:hypothetical protein